MQAVDNRLRAQHASRRQGEGIEFHQYRPYQQGDDLRKVDWRLYGRSDRLYVREALQDSRLTVTLMIDTSASMGLADANGVTRLEYACRVAACLAWLALVEQNDFALIAVGGDVPRILPPGQGRVHFERFLKQLELLDAAGRWESQSVERILRRLPANMLLIGLSDFFEHDREQTAAISEITGRAHTAILMQLLLAKELQFDERGQIEVVDGETGEKRLVSARRFRPTYLKAMHQLLQDTTRRHQALGARVCRATTETSVASLLRVALNEQLPGSARLLANVDL